jgi:hypothetical protein
MQKGSIQRGIQLHLNTSRLKEAEVLNPCSLLVARRLVHESSYVLQKKGTP